MSTLCDKCFHPGWCCKHFKLSQGGNEQTFWADQPEAPGAFLAEQELPFEVSGETWRGSDDEGREYVTYSFKCPHLQGNGRCGIYEKRPDTCKRFEAGSDPLCVHYQGSEGTADDVIV